jgi:hypothetical protein
MLRSVDRKFWISRIFCYLETDEIVKMSEVCTYMHQLVRSPMLTKHLIEKNANTKVNFSVDAFS